MKKHVLVQHLCVMSVLLCYMLVRYNTDWLCLLSDHVVFFMCLFYMWHIKFCYRFNMMTLERLGKELDFDGLDYHGDFIDGQLDRLFVRVIHRNDGSYSRWYEVDYPLCLDIPCYSHCYSAFVRENDSVWKLLKTMKEKYFRNSVIYSREKTNYTAFKYVSFVMLVLFMLLWFLVCWKEGMYDEYMSNAPFGYEMYYGY